MRVELECRSGDDRAAPNAKMEIYRTSGGMVRLQITPRYSDHACDAVMVLSPAVLLAIFQAFCDDSPLRIEPGADKGPMQAMHRLAAAIERADAATCRVCGARRALEECGLCRPSPKQPGDNCGVGVPRKPRC